MAPGPSKSPISLDYASRLECPFGSKKEDHGTSTIIEEPYVYLMVHFILALVMYAGYMVLGTHHPFSGYLIINTLFILYILGRVQSLRQSRLFGYFELIKNILFTATMYILFGMNSIFMLIPFWIIYYVLIMKHISHKAREISLI